MRLHDIILGAGLIVVLREKVTNQRRNTRVNRVTFSSGFLTFAAYSSLAVLFFICLLRKLTIPRSIQCTKFISLATEGISCGFEECNKVAIKILDLFSQAGLSGVQ